MCSPATASDGLPPLSVAERESKKAGNSMGNTTENVTPQEWTTAFADKSDASFAAALAADVVFEATVLRKPMRGPDNVAAVMGAASRTYESLVFTQEAVGQDRTYLEWRAEAFGGLELLGVTILTKDAAGQIAHIAIHHRPLDAAIEFSQHLGHQVGAKVGADYFYQPAATRGQQDPSTATT